MKTSDYVEMFFVLAKAVLFVFFIRELRSTRKVLEETEKERKLWKK